MASPVMPGAESLPPCGAFASVDCYGVACGETAYCSDEEQRCDRRRPRDGEDVLEKLESDLVAGCRCSGERPQHSLLRRISPLVGNGKGDWPTTRKYEAP